jgi:diguanylate cyclase (GGDEF)-like protein
VLVSFLTCLSGGLIGISIAYALFNKSPDWWYLLHYFVGALGVSLFVAWTLERQERLGFLKSILLEYEAQERERLNLELAQLARQDTLTKLANRRCFDERLLEEWDRSLRGQHELALLFLDVDHFKKYNDTYGHSAGDDCLAAVARVIHESLKRPADLASRYGGEEFVVLLPETTRKGATEVAERILLGIEALSIPHAASTTAACVTVSIGLTSCIPDTGLAQVLLDAADSALYSAKHSGRNRIVSTAESTLKVASS